MQAEEKTSKKPGVILFLFGVVFPAGVIGFELFSRICASTFFDPLPTVWHAVLVVIVPASNLAVWLRLNGKLNTESRLLGLLAAMSVGVAGFYTVLFLPLMPLSVVAIMFAGLGLLPFGPLSALVSASVLYSRLCKRTGAYSQARTRSLVFGILCAVFLLVALDARDELTRMGVRWAASHSVEKSRKGIRLLRAVGDEDVLLSLCYFRSGRFSGLLSFPAAFLSRGRPTVPVHEVREIFYRVTGKPFNARSIQKTGIRSGGFSGFQFDGDLGEGRVGGRVRGLRLSSSTLDVSMNHDAALAYLEWTMVFENSSSVDRETRTTIVLPPGAAVSRATLWVNGEEREAVFAAKGKVVEAYRSVVRKRRDPLLVTSHGGDRVMVQAFPVPSNGGTIKYRLGITAPLRISPSPGSTAWDKADLMLPLIVERNFDIDTSFRHALWVEGKRPLDSAINGLAVDIPASGLYRLKGRIIDKALYDPYPVITSSRNITVSRTWTPDPTEPDRAILQTFKKTAAAPSSRTLIVIDGSTGLAPYAGDIIKGLDYLRPSTEVGLIIASDKMFTIRPAEWNNTHKEKIISLITNAGFVGGQDNAPALASAMEMLEHYENGRILWIHAPQPVLFESTKALLEQTSSRLTRLPAIDVLPVMPGPNRLIEEGRWGWSAEILRGAGSVSETLKSYFEETTKERYTVKAGLRRVPRASVPDDAVKTSAHLARLWAREDTFRMLKADREGNWEKAVRTGSKYRVITPAVGAVVLETQEQYKENELIPGKRDAVPTIPEPEEWALLILSLLVIIWLFYQKRILTAIRPA